jgi:hypothetical protein
MAREERRATKIQVVLNPHALKGNPGHSVATPGEEVIILKI